MKKNINLCVVGHMDHGKSTFIGRLLYDAGYIKKYEFIALQQEGREIDFAHFLDIYREERENAMTMDTTKRFFETEKYQYTIIDSPGHKEFIKNMLSGVSEAQYAIVIVSCDEKERIQEQTRRHLALLHLLGVRIAVIAVNKMDSVGYKEKEFNKVTDEMNQFLAYIGCDTSATAFVPIVATRGENISTHSEKMEWYKGETIIGWLDTTVMPAPPSVAQPLRVVVQFTSQEEKLVLGKIEAGRLVQGEEIYFEPAHVQGVVGEISVLGKQVKEAFAGEAVGFIVKSEKFSLLKRGDVGGTGMHKPKPCLQAIGEVIVPFDAKVRVGDEFVFRSGANEGKAIIAEIIKKISSENLQFMENNALSLHEGDIGIVRLQFREQIVVERYSTSKELGRFLLMKEKKAFPGIILQTTEMQAYKTSLICNISPLTMPHLDRLVKQKRVAMLRVNGAFELPDFAILRKYNLPIVLDIPGDRKKRRTSMISDEELLNIAIRERIDFVGLSYVRSVKEMEDVRAVIEKNKSQVKVIAKIETKEALLHLNAITEAADMLLIDRGDLGTDVGYEKVPFYQEKIVAVAKKFGKKIAVATELAMSTINTDRPTHADTTQMHTTVKQGVDYLVLAEETAKNNDPVKSVEIINLILDFAEACYCLF